MPELIEQFLERISDVVHDKNQAVMLSGITLMLAVCDLEPTAVKHFRKHVPQLCKMLRSLLTSGLSLEHDVSGICNPFLQVKLLR